MLNQLPKNSWLRFAAISGGSLLAFTSVTFLSAAKAATFPPLQNNLSAAKQITQIPPLRERQSPEGYVIPTNSQINVNLTNNAGSPIYYEAVGYTGNRVLSNGESVNLQNLPVPLTLRFYKQSGAMLTAYLAPKPGTKNQINLVVEDTNTLNADLDAMRVESNGLIFLM